MIVWRGFSSTSTSMKATKHFLTNKETKKVEGTLFEIQPMWGYDILKLSSYPSEQGETVRLFFHLLAFTCHLICMDRSTSGAHVEFCCTVCNCTGWAEDCQSRKPETGSLPQ